MSKVNFEEWRKEVLAIVDAHADQVTSLEASDDNSIFTFCGETYACEVNISDKWIGCDLGIEVSKEDVPCDYEVYYDYVIPSEDSILETYEWIVDLIQAVFDKRVSFVSTPTYSYIVVEKTNHKYDVMYQGRTKRFWGTRHSSWLKSEISKLEFGSLNISSLKLLS